MSTLRCGFSVVAENRRVHPPTFPLVTTINRPPIAVNALSISSNLFAIVLLCREFLVESAKNVGIEGAAEFLEDPNNGIKEVNEELEKYSAHIGGVPYYVINGKHKLSGGQPPEVFQRAFQVDAN